jgi:hypothetical protein
MHNDKIIYSLIDTCLTTNQNWIIEQAKPESPRRGRAAPPSPAQVAPSARIYAILGE